MKQLICPTCSAEIQAKDINMSETLAVCSTCNTVFNFGDDPDFEVEPKKKKKRDLIHPPTRITSELTANGLEITMRWFRPLAIFLTLFAVFWDGFMLFWYGIAISNQAWEMAAFGSLHLAVGVGLTYYVIALYVNRTDLVIDRTEIRKRVSPLPFPRGNLTISANDIEQLFVKQKVTYSKNGRQISYQVCYRPYGESDKVLMQGLNDSESGKYIEQEIERYLGIRDEAVSGEFGSGY